MSRPLASKPAHLVREPSHRAISYCINDVRSHLTPHTSPVAGVQLRCQRISPPRVGASPLIAFDVLEVALREPAMRRDSVVKILARLNVQQLGVVRLCKPTVTNAADVAWESWAAGMRSAPAQ